MRDFAAIDFETANEQPSSVCSVGVVIVRDGEIVDVSSIPNLSTTNGSAGRYTVLDRRILKMHLYSPMSGKR